MNPISISTEQSFTDRRAEEIAPRVELDTFLAGGAGHVLAAPAVKVTLTRPVVLNPPPEGLFIQRPEGMPPTPEGLLPDVLSPPMTLSRLQNVVCVPGGVAMCLPDLIVAESFNAHWEKKLHHHLDIAGDRQFRLKRPAEITELLPGRYLFLDFQHVPHYGHYIVDVLCRLWAYYYAHEYLGMTDLRVLISGNAHAGFVVPMLHAAGVPPSHVRVIDAPVMVAELFVATKGYQTQEYTSPLAAAVWRRIRDGFDRRQGGPARIYISRSRHPARVCLNEAEAEAIFARHGFTILHPQEMTVAEQIDIIAHAELAAGTSGSNMFNLAFQKNLRSSLIMVSPYLLHYSDQFLNAYHGSDIRYFVGFADTAHPEYDPINVHTPWRVDTPRLEYEILAWLREVGAGRQPLA